MLQILPMGPLPSRFSDPNKLHSFGQLETSRLGSALLVRSPHPNPEVQPCYLRASTSTYSLVSSFCSDSSLRHPLPLLNSHPPSAHTLNSTTPPQMNTTQIPFTNQSHTNLIFILSYHSLSHNQGVGAGARSRLFLPELELTFKFRRSWSRRNVTVG